MQKETPSAATKAPIDGRLLRAYAWSKLIFVIVGGYFLFSIILYATTGIDICIPCLWTAIFGVHCPGCGLTTAMIRMLQLNFVAAWDSNPLAFFVAPVGLYFVWSDFATFRKRFAAQASAQVA